MTILAGGWMAGVADENAGEERERERERLASSYTQLKTVNHRSLAVRGIGSAREALEFRGLCMKPRV